jgi:hypothetical protein
MDDISDYASYLIRLWYEKGEGPSADKMAWHAEVESIQTGESWHFADPESLTSFFKKNFPHTERRPKNDHREQ